MKVSFIVKQTPTPSQPGGLTDSSLNEHTMTRVTEFGGTSMNENSKIGVSTWKIGSNEEKINSPASSDWDLTTTFTIDFWMRFDPFYAQFAYLGSNGGAKIISNFTDGGESDNSGYELGLTSGGELTATYYGDTGLGVTPYTITSFGKADIVTNGGWHHVCWQASDEGEGNVQRLFLDGVSVTNGSIDGTATTSTNPFTLGMRARSDVTVQYPFLYGTMDELEIIDGVAKFSTGGFTPPTTANTATANHILLMHFDDDNPEPTVWYDTTYNAAGQWWNVQGGQTWDGSGWTSFASTWVAQYGWMTQFRPEKVKIVGTSVGSGTVTLTNNDDSQPEHIIASGAGAATILSDTDFESEDQTNDDMHYLKNMTQFSRVSEVKFDAKPEPPSVA